jgi:hypothetical protein
MQEFFQYLVVISGGPLILIRIPLACRSGRWLHLPRWSRVLKALTPVMHSHGLRQKDIHRIDNFWHPDDERRLQADVEDPNLHPRRKVEYSQAIEDARQARSNAERAFEGDEDRFPKFWLYDWCDDGVFELVRRPTA